MLLAIAVPVTGPGVPGASTCRRPTLLGPLLCPAYVFTHFSSSIQHPVPAFLCCSSPGVSARVRTATRSGLKGALGPQRQPMGAARLRQHLQGHLCRSLLLFLGLAKPRMCTAGAQQHPSTLYSPQRCRRPLHGGVGPARGCRVLQKVLMPLAAGASGLCCCLPLPPSCVVPCRRKVGLVGPGARSQQHASMAGATFTRCLDH